MNEVEKKEKEHHLKWEITAINRNDDEAPILTKHFPHISNQKITTDFIFDAKKPQ